MKKWAVRDGQPENEERRRLQQPEQHPVPITAAIAHQLVQVDHSPTFPSGAAQELVSGGREAALIDATAGAGPGEGAQKLDPSIPAITQRANSRYRAHLEGDSSTIAVTANRVGVSIFKKAAGRV